MVIYRKIGGAILIAAVSFVLGGCATSAPITHQPMTARPAPAPVSANGASLYSDSTYRPLFEDARARHVGDVLTIVISENNTASKKSSTDATRKAAQNATVPTMVGISPLASLQGLSTNGTDNYSFASTGDAAMTNAFTSNMSVTVVEVFPNGNLLVSGEKQVAINNGNEFVRFSGVVSPAVIVGNSVKSSQVADAKLEFRQDGDLNAVQTQGWLARFFMSVMPF